MGMNLSWGEVAEFRRKPRPRQARLLSRGGAFLMAASTLVSMALLALALKGCS